MSSLCPLKCLNRSISHRDRITARRLPPSYFQLQLLRSSGVATTIRREAVKVAHFSTVTVTSFLRPRAVFGDWARSPRVRDFPSPRCRPLWPSSIRKNSDPRPLWVRCGSHRLKKTEPTRNWCRSLCWLMLRAFHVVYLHRVVCRHRVNSGCRAWRTARSQRPSHPHRQGGQPVESTTSSMDGGSSRSANGEWDVGQERRSGRCPRMHRVARAHRSHGEAILSYIV